MSINSVREAHRNPALRDEAGEVRAAEFRRFVSGWVRIDTASSHDFAHYLKDIPHVVSVLIADDAQGTNQAEAPSTTITKTQKTISVANAGSAKFFKVRAF